MFLTNNETQQMCDKAILEFGRTFTSVPDRLLQIVPYSYKNQEMCNKAVDNYPHALKLIPECYETQKMSDKAVDVHPSTTKFAL